MNECSGMFAVHLKTAVYNSGNELFEFLLKIYINTVITKLNDQMETYAATAWVNKYHWLV